MVGIDFAAHKGKNIANSTLIRTVIRGLLKNGHKKTPQENSYGVWDRKKALILSYQRLFFRRYLILNLTPRSLPPKNIVLPTNSMFSYPEAGKSSLFLFTFPAVLPVPGKGSLRRHIPAGFPPEHHTQGESPSPPWAAGVGRCTWRWLHLPCPG